MQKFGEKLYFLRKNRNLTLLQLGNLLGVHNTYISQLEKCRRTPNAEMIIKIADTFHVTCDQLMRDELDIPIKKQEK
ncbi:MAG: XRE family transcriptional regulator [Chloroflexi bacterium]|nr:MAG: XRE family transcriptional regulator [Chloroflexota bacterium]